MVDLPTRFIAKPKEFKKEKVKNETINIAPEHFFAEGLFLLVRNKKRQICKHSLVILR